MVPRGLRISSSANFTPFWVSPSRIFCAGAGRNLIRLGSDDFVVPILEITEEWLEEFAKSLLGHPSGLQKYKVQTPFR